MEDPGWAGNHVRMGTDPGELYQFREIYPGSDGEAGMIVTPGTAFGDLGEGYVRIALVHPVETIEKVVRIVKESGILEA